jgi:hypothetical protein
VGPVLAALDVVLIVVNVILFVVPLVAVVGVMAAVTRRNRRPPALAVPAPAGAVVLHARVLRHDQLVSLSAQVDDQTYGQLVITPTELRWQPQVGQPWAVPRTAVTVLGTTGFVTLGPPGIDVAIDGAGQFRLVVSHRPINRFARNDFKRFGESRTAQEVATLLAAGSAGTPGPPGPPGPSNPAGPSSPAEPPAPTRHADPSEPSRPRPPGGFVEPS